MPLSVHITDKALAEIDAALGWYAERSMSAAVRWYVKLRAAILALEDNPNQHGPAPECAWYPGDLRQLVYGNKRAAYRVLFEVRGDTVFVLRVRHCAQDLLGPEDL